MIFAGSEPLDIIVLEYKSSNEKRGGITCDAAFYIFYITHGMKGQKYGK